MRQMGEKKNPATTRGNDLDSELMTEGSNSLTARQKSAAQDKRKSDTMQLV